MTGKADRRFWKYFEDLAASVQKLAREKSALWKRTPITLRVSKNAVTVFVLFVSESIIERLVCARAM